MARLGRPHCDSRPDRQQAVDQRGAAREALAAAERGRAYDAKDVAHIHELLMKQHTPVMNAYVPTWEDLERAPRFPSRRNGDCDVWRGKLRDVRARRGRAARHRQEDLLRRAARRGQGDDRASGVQLLAGDHTEGDVEIRCAGLWQAAIRRAAKLISHLIAYVYRGSKPRGPCRQRDALGLQPPASLRDVLLPPASPRDVARLVPRLWSGIRRSCLMM